MHLISAIFAAFAAADEYVEQGFDNFYKDLVIIEPVPSEQWVCGETVKIIWNPGDDITNGLATDAPQKFDIKLVSGRTPRATENLKKYTIAVDVDVMAGEYEFEVDCEGLPLLCPSCFDDDGVLVDTEDRVTERWNYLIFEDTEMYVDTADGCIETSLNYINENCWWRRSEGAVQIVNHSTPFDLKDTDYIFSVEGGWMNNQTAPLGPHLWGASTVISHRVSYDLATGDIVDMPGYGQWEVLFADYRGIIGAAVLKSLEENVVSVAFRPTRGGELFWDDWMSDFDIAQHGCMDTLEGCQDNFKLHRGFLYEYELSKQAIRDTVLNLIQNDNPCSEDDPSSWRILFTGMSQGGGLAPIAYFDLYNWIQEQVDPAVWAKLQMLVFTTGGPPQGNQHWALWVEANLPPWARERIVLRFDPEAGYISGPLKVHNVAVAGVQLFDLESALKCLERTPPDGPDTAPYATWEWQTAEQLGLPADVSDDDLAWANAVGWPQGDLITMIKSSPECVGMDGYLMFDTKYRRVYDPVYVHWDPDMYLPWCDETGCTALSDHNPPHPDSKTPGEVYSKGYVQDTIRPNRVCANTEGPALGPAGACHDLGLYAHGISVKYNAVPEVIDYNFWKANDEEFSGCSATGVYITQPETTYVPPATEAPEGTGDAEFALSSITGAIGIALLAFLF